MSAGGEMFSNVLIGVDGLQGGRDAIALARQLAMPGAKLTLAHVYGLFLGRGAVEELPIARRDARDVLERERALAGIGAEIVACGGQPVGRALRELAGERQADLLVVGSTRHALLGRVLLGDDSRATLDGAPCAIGIAPHGYAQEQHPLKMVGVGYDGSAESEPVLRAARLLAERHGAQIRTLGVNGEPRYELQRLAERVDLLVIGAHLRGPFARLVHRSISHLLLSHIACPLVVLGPTEDRRNPQFATGRAPMASAGS
jgi:nucleotide-binding universal stress UspA family protein